MPGKKIALVTGGNRGLGYGVTEDLAKKGFKVILTSRDPKKGEQKASELKNKGLDVVSHLLDITDPSSIQSIYHFVQNTFGRLDVLINNAAINIGDERKIEDENQFKAQREKLESTLMTNVVGAYDLCNRFGNLMENTGFGRIVNVSSGAGQLTATPFEGYTTYSISKTALNAVTAFLSHRWKNDVLINSVCPGWVKTDMGGPNAPREIEEGVSSIVWAATLPKGGPTGKFFRDGKPLEW